MQTEMFKKWIPILLTEAFGESEMAPGYFLDHGRDGLLGTLAAVDAEMASIPSVPNGATIAAHANHVLYILKIFNAFEEGQQLQIDWPSSWQTSTVDAAAWAKLQADIKTAYHTLGVYVQARTEWPEQAFAATMIQLVHFGYHLGEIRQMVTVLRARQ